MKIKYNGKKAALEIDKIVNITKNKEITEKINKFFIVRNILIIIVFFSLILAVINFFIPTLNTNICMLAMFIDIVLVIHKKKLKKRCDNDIKNILKDDTTGFMLVQIYYENMKHIRSKSKNEIYIFYIIDILIALNRIDEASQIIEKFGVDRHRLKELYMNVISFKDVLETGEINKIDEKLIQMCCFKIKNKKLHNIILKSIADGLDKKKLAEDNHFINLLKNNIYYKRNKRENKIIKLVTIFVSIFCIVFVIILIQFGVIMCRITKNFSDFNIRKNMIELHQQNVQNSDYYININEALSKKREENNENMKSYSKIIKVIEKDDECLVLQFDTKNGTVWADRLKMKRKNGMKYYSAPLNSPFLDSYIVNENILHNKKKNIKDLIKEDMRNTLFLEKSTANKTQFNFIGGVTDDAEIYNLKINNKTPDEIIELNFKENSYYAWYYTDFKVREQDIDKMNITF